jgi:hypothetical protein
VEIEEGTAEPDAARRARATRDAKQLWARGLPRPSAAPAGLGRPADAADEGSRQLQGRGRRAGGRSEDGRAATGHK